MEAGGDEQRGRNESEPHLASSVRVNWEVCGGGLQAQPTGQVGSANQAGGAVGEVGVPHSSQETSVMGVEPRRDTCLDAGSGWGRRLGKEIRLKDERSPTLAIAPLATGGVEPDTESRIWENRPFGSMRGEVVRSVPTTAAR